MLNCFVKKSFGLLFTAICYFSVDLGYKLLKKSGNPGDGCREVTTLLIGAEKTM